MSFAFLVFLTLSGGLDDCLSLGAFSATSIVDHNNTLSTLLASLDVGYKTDHDGQQAKGNPLAMHVTKFLKMEFEMMQSLVDG